MSRVASRTEQKGKYQRESWYLMEFPSLLMRIKNTLQCKTLCIKQENTHGLYWTDWIEMWNKICHLMIRLISNHKDTILFGYRCELISCSAWPNTKDLDDFSNLIGLNTRFPPLFVPTDILSSQFLEPSIRQSWYFWYVRIV